jgi:hypothetical protein
MTKRNNKIYENYQCSIYKKRGLAASVSAGTLPEIVSQVCFWVHAHYFPE